jgi:PleD family two-component response regulator
VAGVSASMGVASSAVSGADPEALLAAVDSQLYLAEQTRNAVRAPAVPAG